MDIVWVDLPSRTVLGTEQTRITIKGSECDIDKLYYAWFKQRNTGERMSIQFDAPIERVIFHPPATIVLWRDGTKTVVKLHDEDYDAEKGLAMAVMKKVLGTEYRKYVKKAEGWNIEHEGDET